MDAVMIRDTVALLARSQGGYGRLYEAVEAREGGWEELAEAATADEADPSPVGVILWLEG